MKSDIFPAIAVIIKNNGTMIIIIDKTTNNIDQNAWAFFLVFLSIARSGFCRRTAKKNDSKNGAVIQNKYLKNTYTNASINAKKANLIRNSRFFSTLIPISNSFQRTYLDI